MSEVEFNRAIFGCRMSVNFLGIIGNIITFVVFARPAFRKNSISTYCCALAVVECFTILQVYSDLNLVVWYIYPQDQSNVGCKISYYVTVAFSSISGWILVMFAVDKLINMRGKNHKYQFIKKRSFQLAIIGIIVLANTLLYSEILVLLNLSVYNNTTTLDENLDGAYYCSSSGMPYYNIVGAVYLVEASLIPFGFMIWSSIKIIKAINMSRQKSIQPGNAASLAKRKSRDFKFAITSLTFNVTFILLKLPFVLYFIFAGFGIDLSNYYYMLSSLLFYVNASIGFVVHVVSNSLFRKEILVMLHLATKNQVDFQTTLITVRPLRNSIEA